MVDKLCIDNHTTLIGGDRVRTDWVPRQEYDHVLAALMPANRLALEIAEANGLRIGDVLALRTADLRQRMTITEAKTGKSRRIYLSADLLSRAQAQAGRLWVFEGGRDWRKHRTRQAVYKDLMRAARLFRVRLGGAHIGTHTARKIYAVERYHRTGSIEAVRQLLGHEREAVTMLYALADELTARRLNPGPRKGAIPGGPTSSGAAGRAMPGPGADKP